MITSIAIRSSSSLVSFQSGTMLVSHPSDDSRDAQSEQPPSPACPAGLYALRTHPRVPLDGPCKLSMPRSNYGGPRTDKAL